MGSTYYIPSRPIVRKRVFSGKPIKNTRRVERVLKLIKFLSEFRTIRDINKHLEIHEKSVQRYRNLIMPLEFDVEVRIGKYNYYGKKYNRIFWTGITIKF